MDIIIPLGGGSTWGDNNELRYMLRSIECNLIGDFNITIIGHKPDWLINVRHFDTHVSSEYAKKKYRNFYDTLYKLDFISKNINSDFIYAYDDQILLKETSIESCAERKALNKLNITPKFALSKDKWIHTILKANNLLKTHKNVYNYETHIPRTFNGKKLREMFRLFDWHTFPPYAPSTLYYNYFYDNHNLLTEKDKVSFQMSGTGVLVYEPCNTQQINELTKNVMWMNYCAKSINATPLTGGTNYILQDFIKNKFKTPSKYEAI